MKRTLAVHPFLFALFPILFVWSTNLEHISVSKTGTSVLVLLGFTLLFFLLFALILRDAMRAGVMLSLFLVLFFSYGPVFNVIGGWLAGQSAVDGPLVLLLAWAVIFAGGTALINVTDQVRAGESASPPE